MNYRKAQLTKIDQITAHNRPPKLHFIFGKITIFLAGTFATDTLKKQISRSSSQCPQTLQSSQVWPPQQTPPQRMDTAAALGCHFHCCHSWNAEPQLLHQIAPNELCGTGEKICCTSHFIVAVEHEKWNMQVRMWDIAH